MADPPDDGRLPEQGHTADLLAFALVLPGADDPVTGIVDAVGLELHVLAGMLDERGAGDLLLMLSQRLAVASLLLRRIDGSAAMPPEYDPDVEGGEDEGSSTGGASAAPGATPFARPRRWRNPSPTAWCHR